MITESIEELCLLIEEEGTLLGVSDSGCSKTVAGERWLNNYVIELPKELSILIIT